MLAAITAACPRFIPSGDTCEFWAAELSTVTLATAREAWRRWRYQHDKATGYGPSLSEVMALASTVESERRQREADTRPPMADIEPVGIDAALDQAARLAGDAWSAAHAEYITRGLYVDFSKRAEAASWCQAQASIAGRDDDIVYWLARAEQAELMAQAADCESWKARRQEFWSGGLRGADLAARMRRIRETTKAPF